MSCPTMLVFGESITGPAGGGPTTFVEGVSLVSKSDDAAAGVASVVSAFYTTAFARTESATLEVSWQRAGERVPVGATAGLVETVPIFEGTVIGRNIVAFPVPLPCPMGAGENRYDLRVALSNISVNCQSFRVFVQTAYYRDGVWRF